MDAGAGTSAVYRGPPLTGPNGSRSAQQVGFCHLSALPVAELRAESVPCNVLKSTKKYIAIFVAFTMAKQPTGAKLRQIGVAAELVNRFMDFCEGTKAPRLTGCLPRQ